MRAFFGLVLIAAVAGFVGYLLYIAGLRPDPEARFDAIVVLTGTPGRVETGLSLLEEGRGERLLISGVYDQTTMEDIRAMAPPGAARIDCCVDLDYVAEDTYANARETAEWARQNGYTRLLLVTSAFHVPRSRLELKHAAPDLELVAWPVGKWTDSGVRKLLLEYAKLSVVMAREALRRITQAF